MYRLPAHGIRLSPGFYQKLCDHILKVTEGIADDWHGNYEMVIHITGAVEASPVEPNRNNFPAFILHMGEKVVFLPTPRYVGDSTQEIYICFENEALDEILYFVKNFTLSSK